jgi:hypothetical protein
MTGKALRLSMMDQLSRQTQYRGRPLAQAIKTKNGNICRLSDLERLEQRMHLSEQDRIAMLCRFTDMIRACSYAANFQDLIVEKIACERNNSWHMLGNAAYMPMKMIISATNYGCSKELLPDREKVNGRAWGNVLQIEMHSLPAIIRAYRCFLGQDIKLPDNAILQNLPKNEALKLLGQDIFTADAKGIYLFSFGKQPKFIVEKPSNTGCQVWANLVIVKPLVAAPK